MKRIARTHHGSGHNPPELATELIGHFSIDSNLEYRADLSQLKYYIPPPNPNNVNFDLNRNFMFTPSNASHIELDNILRWISNNFPRIVRPLSEHQDRWLDADFICSRDTLSTILCFLLSKTHNKLTICASKYKGNIYLCKFPNEIEHHDDAAMPETQKSSWLYKFKRYLLADHPSHEPNPSAALNNCEKFHCMFKANFGKHSLLYGAEIDGIYSQQPITDTLVGKNFEFIGLKTLKMLSGQDKSTPSIISKYWSTNYLVKTDRIVVGHRDLTNTVKTMKEYSPESLLNISHPFCDATMCKQFCMKVLNVIKRTVVLNHNKCIYKICCNSTEKLQFSQLPPDDKTYSFLKPWFIDEAEKYVRAQQIARALEHLNLEN